MLKNGWSAIYYNGYPFSVIVNPTNTNPSRYFTKREGGDFFFRSRIQVSFDHPITPLEPMWFTSTPRQRLCRSKRRDACCWVTTVPQIGLPAGWPSNICWWPIAWTWNKWGCVWRIKWRTQWRISQWVRRNKISIRPVRWCWIPEIRRASAST